jgi:hypothetical protein
VNGGKRWPDHSSQTVRLPLSGTVRLEDIEGVRLETTFGGGVGGDNWNLSRLMVWARIGGVTRQLFDKPVFFRFTNDQRSRVFYFGQAAGRFDFNLEWSAPDPNGFPLNPRGGGSGIIRVCPVHQSVTTSPTTMNRTSAIAPIKPI